MRITADTHTHTVASGHAYSTMDEMARAAREKGLELIAITDHGPAMPDGAHEFYFQNARIWPKKISNVRVLKGAEISIIDTEGTLEFTPYAYDVLEIVVASFHPPAFSNFQAKDVNRAIIAMMQNKEVHVIGHPDDNRFPIDYKEAARAAADTNTALEVNCSSLGPFSFREGARDNYLRMLEQCDKFKTGVTVASDAHYHIYVGELDRGIKLIEEAGFPEHLVVNKNANSLLHFLNIQDNDLHEMK